MDSAREFTDRIYDALDAQREQVDARPLVVELISARDADLWRMAQEQMMATAKQCCIVKTRNGEDCYDTNVVDVYERISMLPLDPLPAGHLTKDIK